MQIHIVVTTNDNRIVADMRGNALMPLQFKTPYEQPESEKVAGGDGEYKFFGFTYQPMVQLTGKAGGF